MSTTSTTSLASLAQGVARLHNAADARRRLRRFRRVARFLDDTFHIPGTGLRFGADSLIGLVPGVGDAATAIISLYLVHEARRLGVPKRVLLRMAANVGIDAAVGAVPLVGDVADFAFKANRKNLRLLERHLESLEGSPAD